MLKSYVVISSNKRLKALFVDIVLPILPIFMIAIVYAVLQIVIAFFGIDSEASMIVSSTQFFLTLIGALSLIWIQIYWLISLWLIRKTGQTLGKRKMGVMIINRDSNSKIRVIKYVLSRFGVFVVIFLSLTISPAIFLFVVIDVGMIFFDENSETLHDKIWNTRVVESSGK